MGLWADLIRANARGHIKEAFTQRSFLVIWNLEHFNWNQDGDRGRCLCGYDTNRLCDTGVPTCVVISWSAWGLCSVRFIPMGIPEPQIAERTESIVPHAFFVYLFVLRGLRQINQLRTKARIFRYSETLEGQNSLVKNLLEFDEQTFMGSCACRNSMEIMKLSWLRNSRYFRNLTKLWNFSWILYDKASL